MAHEWDRGVLAASSWHALEKIGVFVDAESMMDHGYDSGAWPVSLTEEAIRTVSSALVAPGRAVVAHYRKHPDRAVSVVGDRYRWTMPEEWRRLVEAAVAAGAKPTGAFSLREGSRVLATFEVGAQHGIRTNLTFADAFDGSMFLTTGTSSVRTECANTLARSQHLDGAGWARLQHTACLEERVKLLESSIAESIASGERVRAAYDRAKATVLPPKVARIAFDALFPKAPETASPAAKNRAESIRDDARVVAALPINREGSDPGTLATLWNAATYLVDRKADGSPRPVRGGRDMLDSMLFGSRGDRVQEVLRLVEVVMRDGTVERMAVAEAQAHGIDDGQIGRAILHEMMQA